MKKNQELEMASRAYKGGGGGGSKKKTPKAPDMLAAQAPDMSGYHAMLAAQQQQAAQMEAEMHAANARMMQQTAEMQAKLMGQIKPGEPPPKMSLMESQDAEDQKKKDAANRQGIKKSLLAGETGGYAGPTATGKTLLG
jgi:hypothetical protein